MKKNKRAKSFFKKQVSKLTVGDTCKFTGIVMVLSLILAVIPMAIYWVYSKVKEFITNRKKKAVVE